MPEQILPTEAGPAEAVSSVKAFALAAAEAQRVFSINANADNAGATYAGIQITTHQYQISRDGWIGKGYIDTDIGAGAYKIAGVGLGACLRKWIIFYLRRFLT